MGKSLYIAEKPSVAPKRQKTAVRKQQTLDQQHTDHC